MERRHRKIRYEWNDLQVKTMRENSKSKPSRCNPQILQDARYVSMREQIDKKAIQKRSEQLGNPRNITTNPSPSTTQSCLDVPGS